MTTQADLPIRPLDVVEETLVDEIAALVRADHRAEVLERVDDLHPNDIERILSRLPDNAARVLFDWLPEDKAGHALAEMERAERQDFLEAWKPAKIVAALDIVDTDDAADVLADLAPDVIDEVLGQLEDAAEIDELLAYEEESAGGLMDAELVKVRETATVGEAIEELRREADTVAPAYAIFVVDTEGRFVGVADLMELLLVDDDTPITSVMQTHAQTVDPYVDQEEVALVMERYDLVVIPVVSASGHLLGRITIDDIVDVIRDEVEEDFQRASGLAGDEEFTAGVLQVSRGRLPWLFVGLVGSAMSGLVIGSFESSLEAAVVLAVFIPVVTAMGGNAAVQSGAISVQGLATGEIWASDVPRRLFKEVAVASLNGVALAAALTGFVAVTGLGDEMMGRLALTVCATLFTVIVVATTNGAITPLVLDRLGIDPSLSMGPFVTTLNDIIGLTIYFLYASALFF